MLIVLLAPPLFRRLGLPGLVGLIISGAVVGPHALGLLQRGSTFELLGTVGLLYLMFTAGLSLDLNQFDRYRGRSLTFGVLSFLFPAGLAYAVGTGVLGYDAPTSLLLGSVVGSHTLLAYPVAARLGITKNAAVTMTMGGTMVTDVISLVLLAVVSATVGGSTGVWFWIGFGGLVTAYGAAVFAGLPRLGQWFFRTVSRQADLEFVFLLAVVFVTAYVAELVYLAPIIGAFLAGIALNRLVPERSGLMLRIEFVGDALFIPFFLISVGMLVDASVLLEGWTVGLYTVTFAALVWVGKGVAACGASLLYGFDWDEAWTVFGLSTPQAAATLAVTLVGFEMGLFDEAVVNAVILLILVTALVGPWLVETYGRKVALREREHPYEASQAPQRILVPLSNPETVDDLMDLAVLFHEEHSEEPIYPVTVVRDGPDAEARVALGEELLSHAVVHAADSEIPVVPITRVDYNVASGMVRAITEERISTVVVGWSGDNSARSYIFGSVLDQLLEETEEMIVVSRIRRRIPTHRRLILAVPPYAEREVGFSAMAESLKRLAERSGFELHVVGTEESLGAIEARLEELPPELTMEHRALARWREIVPVLEEMSEPEDLIVLVSEREGSVAWRPSLRRLPTLLMRRLEENTVLTVYMAERGVRASVASDVDRFEPELLQELVRPEDVVLDLDEGDEGSGFARLLGRTVGSDGAISSVEEVLTGDESYAPELRSGVALYHAHLRERAESRLLVGIASEGVALPRVSWPARVVFVLLGGGDLSPEDHVKRLSIATTLARSEDTVEALVRAKTSDDVCAELISHLHEHPILETTETS